MEGRTIARPYQCEAAKRHVGAPRWPLQWRAGQLPGHTGVHVHGAAGSHDASMEGRTIARPYSPTPEDGADVATTFNGGPDNCPAIPDLLGGGSQAGIWRFNGGPDNCPAIRMIPGRAVQRGSPSFNGGPDNCPAILQSPERSTAQRSPCALQWRAGQLPGHTRDTSGSAEFSRALQWRAGQLPGHTSPRHSHACNQRESFNGGPDNCPAIRELPTVAACVRIPASMEGRTIARPYRSSELVCLTCPFAGVCERCRKHELRRCLDSVVKLRFACSCKASSGP